MAEFEWIEDAGRLSELVRQGRDLGVVGFDTECNGFYAYYERVCLLQLRVGDRTALIDGLHPPALEPIAELLADPDTTKVMHGAEFDVLALQREWQMRVRGLFDTMHAARVAGERGLSLGKLVTRHFGAKLDKRFQRYDWGRRPIAPAALHYAARDVQYLLPLHETLSERLTEQGRLDKARAAFRKVERMVPRPRVFDPNDYRRLKGFDRLERGARQALRRLFVLREEIAEAADRAPFRILNPDTLVRVAEERPRTPAQLQAVRGVSDHLVRRHGEALLRALRPPRRSRRGRTSGAKQPAPRGPSERRVADADQDAR